MNIYYLAMLLNVYNKYIQSIHGLFPIVFSHATFCSASCGLPMIFAYSSGLLAFLYRYPPALINFCFIKNCGYYIISQCSAFCNNISKRINNHGTTVFNWSSSIPMGLEKTAYMHYHMLLPAAISSASRVLSFHQIPSATK